VTQHFPFDKKKERSDTTPNIFFLTKWHNIIGFTAKCDILINFTNSST